MALIVKILNTYSILDCGKPRHDLRVSIGLSRLNLNSSGNWKLLAVWVSVSRLCNIIFKYSLVDVLLNVNLFSTTSSQVCFMCIRFVDFYEPMYHRLLTFIKNISSIAVLTSYYIFVTRKEPSWKSPAYLKPL